MGLYRFNALSHPASGQGGAVVVEGQLQVVREVSPTRDLVTNSLQKPLAVPLPGCRNACLCDGLSLALGLLTH